ncbi:FMN-linked oxidoreductase [Coprinellus micaceus]|uniref:Dihydroorotate oxidase n=1 Tax=Coprinellus micaceus TaxID=71717 RepID=A0A4Y7TZ66_COPMI|nr:FMN-linked oxidoreductase [Coprinellus micaceus]
MVTIGSIEVSPPLLNSSCAWSSDLGHLQGLYDSPFTGAITTRTATLEGFKQDESHTVVFSNASTTALNSYGYSPHPLSQYLVWVKQILQKSNSDKPIIVSITSHTEEGLKSLVSAIQGLRQEIGDMARTPSRVAIELNTSCPNIKNASPSGYAFHLLKPLLHVLAEAATADSSLTVGLKLPPYVYREQFVDALEVLSELGPASFIAFLTCCNTLGNSLLFPEQVGAASTDSQFAVPTALGGLSGESVHALALGNVFSFAKLIHGPEACFTTLSKIRIIGVGGVTSKDAAERAGADAVACATFFGKEGVRAFEILSS